MQLGYGRKLLRYGRNLVFYPRLVYIDKVYIEISPLNSTYLGLIPRSSRADTPRGPVYAQRISGIYRFSGGVIPNI